MIKIVDADRLDLADHIRPGDTVTWGQATAEPRRLVETFVAQRSRFGPVKAFVGLALSDSLMPEHTDAITPISYGALGTTARLQAAGKLRHLPCHYSAIPRLMESGHLPIDVVFVQLSPPGPDGSHSLGYVNDFLPAAMRSARLVIGEINEHAPWTHMDAPVDEDRIAFAIRSSAMPPTLTAPPPNDRERQIAGHVAAMIKDGATLQYGVGSIPAALLEALSGHRYLGLHSGLITEQAIDLVEKGVVTNARKPVHPGISVAATAIGGPRMKAFLHDNPEMQLHEIHTTHGTSTLSKIDNLVAVNSALEVDLYGQVNAERIGDRYLGAIGGQVDYMHAATTAADGLSIVAMPATTGHSGGSRIVPRLGGPFVTTCRTDVDLVVTEFGVADLRGKTVAERAQALIAIALPEHQDMLRAETADLG